LTPAVPSPSADPIVALGERILTELDEVHTNDTLTRWLAHHIADLIEAAGQVSGASAPDADARAAILQLWQHRSAWPSGWPPPRALATVRLLDGLPDLDDPPQFQATALARLHELHHRIIAALVDLATGDDDNNIDQGWLETFGERLNPEEIEVLTRAATTDQRLISLHRWWDRTRSETNPDETEIDDGDAEPAAAANAPLAELASIYRQTVLKLLDHARETNTNVTEDVPSRAQDTGAATGESESSESQNH